LLLLLCGLTKDTRRFSACLLVLWISRAPFEKPTAVRAKIYQNYIYDQVQKAGVV